MQVRLRLAAACFAQGTNTRRLSRLLAVVSLVALVIASGTWVVRVRAEMATPASAANARLNLVEHADLVTEIDLGEPGPSIGDMLVWGPNAFYDEADVNDTGATTQGTCIAFNHGGGEPSTRTIVGGSGRYLGAIGTMAAVPSADLLLWTKTIEIAAPSDR
jgi:hypothetical protein